MFSFYEISADYTDCGSLRHQLPDKNLITMTLNTVVVLLIVIYQLLIVLV
ncbi:MAG: hypothetical protein OFPII_21120 [Osedax symbiont Rs1]|nr:MAG: hypothetical protein OFPII_21120 [Osedax symbiont Rs1]